MPRYELMYLLGANVADTDVPQVADQVKQFIHDAGGTNVLENHWGKKKLAYPIGKTRNGYYIVADFSMDGRKVSELDAKLHTQTATVIRHLIVNVEDHLKRMDKDRAIQAKAAARRPRPEGAAQPAEGASAVPVSPEELEAKIEAALSEDVSKS